MLLQNTLRGSRLWQRSLHIFWTISQTIRLFPDIQEGLQYDRDPALGLKKCRRETSEGSVSAGLRFVDSRAAEGMENAGNSGVRMIRKTPSVSFFFLKPQSVN